MKSLLLERFAYSPESTEGELFLVDSGNPAMPEHLCWTLELPWFMNAPGASCIPEFSYWLAPHVRPDGRESFIVWGGTVSQARETSHDLPRYGILFHAANRTSQLQGCVAPGLERRPGRVVDSQRAMYAIKAALRETFQETDRVVLTIRQRAGAI